MTGKPLLSWPGRGSDKKKRQGGVKRDNEGNTVKVRLFPSTLSFITCLPQTEERSPAARVPCTQCPGCKTRACGACDSCRALPRQRCVARSCVQPVLDTASTCYICSLDGWYASTHMSLIDRYKHWQTVIILSSSRQWRLFLCFVWGYSIHWL